MTHEILKLKSVHPAEGYSHAAKAGKTLYIAGQVAKDRDGKLVGRGDLKPRPARYSPILKNILEEAGGSLAHIVKMTTFLTHFHYRDAFRNVRQEFFTEPFLPHTFLVVQSLAMPEYLIEVEAVAALN